jgi:hypothetical protein
MDLPLMHRGAISSLRGPVALIYILLSPSNHKTKHILALHTAFNFAV